MSTISSSGAGGGGGGKGGGRGGGKEGGERGWEGRGRGGGRAFFPLGLSCVFFFWCASAPACLRACVVCVCALSRERVRDTRTCMFFFLLFFPLLVCVHRLVKE